MSTLRKINLEAENNGVVVDSLMGSLGIKNRDKYIRAGLIGKIEADFKSNAVTVLAIDVNMEDMFDKIYDSGKHKLCAFLEKLDTLYTVTVNTWEDPSGDTIHVKSTYNNTVNFEATVDEMLEKLNKDTLESVSVMDIVCYIIMVALNNEGFEY